jgi:hypothetical protein
MDEAARRFDLSFVLRTDIEELQSETNRLRKENERLGVATNHFTDGFAGLVSGFLAEIAIPVSESGSPDEIGNDESTDSISGQAVDSLSK